MYLFLSIAMLAVGPLVFRLLHPSDAAGRAIDAFVLTSVGGLVLLHVLPDALAEIGPAALGLALLGLGFPLFIERVGHAGGRVAHGLVLAAAVLALLLHTMLDGIALGTTDVDGHIDPALAGAIILHRFPVGLAVWWLVRPTWGVRRAIGVVAAIGAATAAGFAMSGTLQHGLSTDALAFVQAFIAGSLLHVLMHESITAHDHGREPRRWQIVETLGAALGVLAVVAVPLLGDGGAHDHGHGPLIEEAHATPFAESFLHLGLQIAPVLLGVYGLVCLYGLLSSRVDNALHFGLVEAVDRTAPWVMAALAGAALFVSHTAAGAPWQWASLAALGLLFGLSVLRVGPRDFALTVFALGRSHDHDHHGHHHHRHD